MLLRTATAVSVNKRLDEWVMDDRMDLSKLELAKKEAKTPVKLMNGSHPGSHPGSRASSPDRELFVASRRCCALAKKIRFYFLVLL